MRLAIIDCQTTGLDDDDEPISLGVVAVRIGAQGVGEALVRLYQERKASVAISLSAELFHGISDSALEGKSFDTKSIHDALAGAECVVSHNARFDARMLAKVLPDALNWNWRCTLGQRPFREVHETSLQAICDHFGILRPPAHNALSNAEALLRALNHRSGKTTRSKTFLQHIVECPRWPVFSKKDPFLVLSSTDNILFSSISDKVLIECREGTEIRLWTHPGISFVVGYARMGGNCGGQGECFRYSKLDNTHVFPNPEGGQEYLIQSFSEAGVLITPAHAWQGGPALP